jgi:hypothetical protein
VSHLLVERLPEGRATGFTLDGSTRDRCDAEVGPERLTTRPPTLAVSGGLEYQWVCQLNWAPEARAPMEVIRIASKSDATRATLGIQAGATGSSTQTLHRTPTDHLCEDVRQDPGTLQVFGVCDLARAIGQPSPSDADYDTITTSGTGARLIQHGWWAGHNVHRQQRRGRSSAWTSSTHPSRRRGRRRRCS